MDVSNKTLAVLLIAAIVVSLGGTLLSTGGQKTGAATTGTVDYSVTDNLVVNFSTTAIDFLSGYVVVAGGPCVLSSDAAADAGCAGSWADSPGGLVLENVGNIACSVNMSVNDTDTGLIGAGSNVLYKITDGGDFCTTEAPGSYTAINGIDVESTICNSLATTGGNNMTLDFQLSIAEADAASGDSGTLQISIEANDAVV